MIQETHANHETLMSHFPDLTATFLSLASSCGSMAAGGVAVLILHCSCFGSLVQRREELPSRTQLHRKTHQSEDWAYPAKSDVKVKKLKKGENAGVTRLMQLWTPFQRRLVLHGDRNNDGKVVKDGFIVNWQSSSSASPWMRSSERDLQTSGEPVRLVGCASSQRLLRLLQAQMAQPTLCGCALERMVLQR